MSAKQLAAVTRLYNESTELHREADNKVHSIADRLGTIRNRMSEITQSRISGTATGEQADEFVLITADANLLDSMLTDAISNVQELQVVLQARLREVQAAEKAHQHEQAVIEFSALQGKTAEIEALFVRAIALSDTAGRKIGHSVLGQSWRPTEALDRAFKYGIAPQVV